MIRGRSFVKNKLGLTETQQLAIIAIVVASIVVAAVLIASLQLPNWGTIKTIGLECDTDAIDWGDIYPTEIKQASFMLTNNGTQNGTLSMVTQGLPADLICTWNREGYYLRANYSVMATVTLEAVENATAKDFAFDIVITLTAEGGEQS